MTSLDFPITSSTEDSLGRDGLALALSQEIARLDARRGAVVAITGTWGSGKSSLLNLTAAHLVGEDVDVLEFNPWLYTGAEHLAATFLAELANRLEPVAQHRWRRADAVVKAVQKYGELLVALRPVPGGSVVHGTVTGAAAAVRGLLAGRDGLEARRTRVIEALAKHPRRIVVLMDDLDRLETTEIREVLRMVRLVASFPNVVYVLCLDRAAVARALDEEGRPGHEYLDKFLTITCDVPRLGRELPPAMLLEPLDAVLESHGVTSIDLDRFGAIYHRVLRPLVRTPRDAKRLIAALPLVIGGAWPDVSAEDLVALEAVRICAPELHSKLERCALALTTPGGSGGAVDPDFGAAIKDFVDTDGPAAAVGRGLIETLFPAAEHYLGGTVWASGQTQMWESQRRVAAGPVLDFYLSRLLPRGTAPRRMVDEVKMSFANIHTARSTLARVRVDQLVDLLRQLEDADLSGDAATNAVEALLDLYPRLPDETPGPFGMDASFAVSRPVLRYLRRLHPDAVGVLARRLVGSAELYGAFELVMLVGHREHVGHSIVATDEAEEIEQLLVARLTATDAAEIAATRSPLRLVFHTLRPPEGASAPAIPQITVPVLSVALLKDGIAVTKSGPMGGVMQPHVTGLHWDVLVALFGGESAVVSTAQTLAAASPDDDQLGQVADFAQRYATGWRPEPFGRGS